MTENIFRETADQIDEARAALLKTANDLRRSLSEINRYGDTISPHLTRQGDGFAWGEIYDGLKILIRALYPDDGIEDRTIQITDAMFESDITIEEAAQHVADAHAPMAGYPTDEIREQLVMYRAWLRALDDGMIDPVRVVGEGENAPEQARTWLNKQIDERLAALAYRGLTETEESS